MIAVQLHEVTIRISNVQRLARPIVNRALDGDPALLDSKKRVAQRHTVGVADGETLRRRDLGRFVSGRIGREKNRQDFREFSAGG